MMIAKPTSTEVVCGEPRLFHSCNSRIPFKGDAAVYSQGESTNVGRLPSVAVRFAAV